MNKRNVQKLELGFFFSPAEARAGELRAAARAGPRGKSSNLQQKKLEVEDELEFQARLELQVQALETQARTGPGRRRRRPCEEGGESGDAGPGRRRSTSCAATEQVGRRGSWVTEEHV